jgi:uncharacterized Zn finger protein
LIGARGRGNYTEACRFLKKVRQLYNKLGEDDQWTRYPTQLREKHRNLRALHEEMAKAHL